MVLYRSSECIGYAELEQDWNKTIICCIAFTHVLGNKFDHVIEMGKVNPVSTFEQVW